MGQKENARFVEITGGQLKYNRIKEIPVSDQGTGSDNINFSTIVFEAARKKVNHISIINDGGTNAVYFVFDAQGTAIDTNDWMTYNGKVYAGTPYNKISYDGEADSIGFRCETGKTTTIKVMVW